MNETLLQQKTAEIRMTNTSILKTDPPAQLNPKFPWDLIIELVWPLIVEAIKDCINNDGEEETRKRLKNPGVLEYLVILRTTRQATDLRGFALMRVAKGLWRYLKDSPSIVEEVMALAMDVNNIE
jgi:hypothetical protein